MTTGRFAPSPSAPLHVGNLRTALLAWCAARAAGGRFLIRIEDLTTSSVVDHAVGQLADLTRLGIDHDGAILRQSDRFRRYDEAIGVLVDQGRTYPCYCSRREIRDAAAAPHGPSPDGAYPGTCRGLDAAQRRDQEAAGRRPALRLRAEGAEVAVSDRLLGEQRALVDDVVLRRADGVVAYNLAVVLDDADQGVDQVVRGDDLWETTPRQVLLQRLLGLPTPEYVHVPLVLGPDGERLAKRDGAVTLAERLDAGDSIPALIGAMAASAGLAAPGEDLTASEVAERFDVDRLDRRPWVFTP